MKNILMMTAFTLLLPVLVFAGSNHFHPKKVAKCGGPCSEEQIKASIPDAIPHLNKWGKIDLAWAKAKVDSVQQKQFKKGPEWVVTLVNDKKEKQFVFVTLDGFVTGANATGE